MITTKQLTKIALITAILCIMGPLSIYLPFTPIPISLELFAIIIGMYVLTPKENIISVILYILIGLIGLPVFSGFEGGIGKLLGPSGGFILGYIPFTLIGAIFINIFSEKKCIQIIFLILDLILLYLLGSAYLSYQTDIKYINALQISVLPFIATDILKIIIAVVLGNRLSLRLSKYQS